MAAHAQKTPRNADAEQALAGLAAARRQTLELVAGLDHEQLRRVHSPIMSPLVWDLAHIAAYEDLWLAHRHAGLELLRPDVAELYDAFETPRAQRGSAELLDAHQARGYMRAVRARVAAAIREQGPGDGLICEIVTRHELQHSETMRQTMAIAGLLPPGEPPPGPREGPQEWVEVPAGSFTMGASGEGFAYDNERPAHAVELPAYAIARRPVSNEGWLRFRDEGGYERSELWSQAGWQWRCEHGIAAHPAIAAGDPRAPVCHVSWYEAEAYARAAGARLPSEAEWEKAARNPRAGSRAASPNGGLLDAVGHAWEWTQSTFEGYPGFVAHPYREYSEVFFGEGYHVLRGGSWATSERVASPTFRNWDLPQRRQIFAGIRLAMDVR
jgi:gamma-glutamyl hercynylcysteine S-oxide synthase